MASARAAPAAPDDSFTFYDLALCQEMVDAACSLGWRYPTPIQIRAIPPALAGSDVCGMAETGSGKTGAFALPVLHRLLEERHPMFALVLEPTRELALQVASVFRALGERIGALVCAITGGMEEKAQLAALDKRPHVIVATIGRFVQILRDKPLLNLKTVKVVVFDEADRMLSVSFMDEVRTILERIGGNCQSLLFSATMPDEIETLVRVSLTDPVTVSLTSRNQVVGSLREYVVVSPSNRKEATLYALLKEMGNVSCIVFTNSCKSAHILTKMLQALRIGAVLYHGKLEQKHRQLAVEQFRQGKYAVLVATNVASRGLDVPHVDCVVNYDLPEKHEEYIHRVGRAGRAARCGFAITIVTMNDMVDYAMLEKFLKKKLERKPLDDGEIEAVYPDVEHARKAGVESYREFSKRKAQKKKGR
jgi:ATP-dependent RNA helicase DDX47/RRP3